MKRKNILRMLCVCLAMLTCMTTMAQGLEHPWKGKKVAYFGDSITDPAIRAEIDTGMQAFALDPDAIARTVEFAIDQPWEVEIGELVIRPTVQG